MMTANSDCLGRECGARNALVSVLVLSMLAASCRSVSVSSVAYGEPYPPEPSDWPIHLYEYQSDVERPHKKIGRVWADVTYGTGSAKVLEALKDEARSIGADALIVSIGSKVYDNVSATAIRYLDRPSSAQAANNRYEETLLAKLNGRVEVIRSHDLNFQERIVRERNDFFAWLRGPQQKLAQGEISPQEMGQVGSRMADTYDRWAGYFNADADWLEAQVPSVQSEIAIAQDHPWSESRRAHAAGTIETLNGFLRESGEVIRSRREGASDMAQEADKLLRYVRTLSDPNSRKAIQAVLGQSGQ